MSVLYNPWHEVISRLRNNKGLTQEQAAEAAGVAANTWSRWEQKGFSPNDKQAQKIVKALEIEADDLGAIYAVALSAYYFPVPGKSEPKDDNAAEKRLTALTRRSAEAPAESKPERPAPPGFVSAKDIDGGPFANAVLDSVAGEPFQPRTFPEFLDGMVSKLFVIVAGTTRIMVDILSHYSEFSDETTDEEHANVVKLWKGVHELHGLCLTVSGELHEIELSQRPHYDYDELGQMYKKPS